MAVLETLLVRDAARLKGVHVDTIYAAIENNELTVVDCKGVKRVVKTALEEWTPKSIGRPPKQRREQPKTTTK